WWHGADALTTLIAADRRAQQLWGIGSKSAAVAQRSQRRGVEGQVKAEHGYSLVELLVTMVILSVVLSGLTTVFISGSSAQVRLNERFVAQQNARLAMDRLRVDIHCASQAQAQTINGYPGIKLNVSNCSATSPVSYCVIQLTSTPVRYQLYRATGTGTTDCTATDTTRAMVADYLTSSSVFT